MKFHILKMRIGETNITVYFEIEEFVLKEQTVISIIYKQDVFHVFCYNLIS